jgi:hypothetical protein
MSFASFWKSSSSRPLAPAAGPSAEELIARARTLHAESRFVEAVETAERALARQEAETGERDPSLVPYLLTLAGLLYLTAGWNAARPHYERAERLRGPRPVPGARRPALTATPA